MLGQQIPTSIVIMAVFIHVELKMHLKAGQKPNYFCLLSFKGFPYRNIKVFVAIVAKE